MHFPKSIECFSKSLFYFQLLLSTKHKVLVRKPGKPGKRQMQDIPQQTEQIRKINSKAERQTNIASW